MATDRIRLFPVIFLAAPALVLACGPFFYPAPPTLDHYPERLPVKTMRELLSEGNPPPADAATFEELSEETRDIAAALVSAPRDKLLHRIDTALDRNRAGDYRKRISNCLYDLRDLLVSGAVPAAEGGAYADWRIEAMDWDDGFFEKKPAAESWQRSPVELEEMSRAWQQKLTVTASRLSAEILKASPVLKPHWLVQAGAWQFKHAQFDAAAQLFQQVIDETPQHPRAEIARLMLARTRMEKWRSLLDTAKSKGESETPEVFAARREADNALDAYLEAHPAGRFARDIPGWRGGMARDAGDPANALAFFLVQVDFIDHPEIVRGAVRECEGCLDELDLTKIEEEVANNGGATLLPLDEIARRPLAALAVVYHFLDSESRRDFDELLGRVDSLSDRDITDRYLPPVLRMRRAGRVIFPALAKAVAAQKQAYGSGVWRPKYLSILAWAATEAGEHRQAIRVCDLAGPAMDQSDDLLFVRAVALQRAGELEAALAAFQHLREIFPESPLAVEARFRIATLLRDQHESGAAVVEMLRIIADQRADERKRQEDAPDKPLPLRSRPQLHLESELQQWIDTLLQFAPLAELERGLVLPDLEPEFAVRLREMLQMRHLACEDFAAARRFVQPAAEPPTNAAAQLLPSNELFTRTFQENGPFPKRLEADDWARAVADLEKLTQAARAPAKPTARAQNLFALAEGWSALRGRLTLPASEDFGMCKDQFHQVWAQRYANARMAGFTETAAASELERQDELRHAFRYFLDSAEASPGTPLSARALWAANDAIRRMAELSPWLSQRAFETNASTVSRQLHERLLRDCPTSQEAKRLSVWWTFPPKAELHWMPGKWQDYDVEFAIAAGFGDPPVDDWSVYPPFRKRLEDVGANAGTWDVPKLIEELNAIRREFLPVFGSSEGSSIINDLDDLTLFLQEPGLTPSVRAKYFAGRLGKAPADVNDPALQHWRDYVTFLAMIREAPPGEPAAADNASGKFMSERMKEFLATYPNSRKREAALARLAIATVHETRTHTGVKSTAWPEAPKLNGYKAIVVRHGQPFDAARVFSAIDNYEREFPNGRYKAEMRLWRGAASIDAGDWETALNLLVATLDDPTKRDLHLDASLNLADVFMRLIEQPQSRPEIIAAIANSPSAQKRLYQFMHSETLGARFCCLEGYLQEQFAAAGAK